MRKSLFFVSLLAAIAAAGQPMETVSLSQCYEAAVNHHPLTIQPKYLQAIEGKKNDILQTRKLPILNFTGQATYQSDVTHVDIAIPNAPAITAPKDQYRTALDVSQSLYNGGSIKASQQLIHTETNYKIQEVETHLYRTKLQVNELYYNILILKTKMQSIDTLLIDLQLKADMVHAAVENGIMLKSNEAVIKTEILKLKQQKTALKATLTGLTGSLSYITGLSINTESTFTLPETNPTRSGMNRPETKLYNLQKNLIDANTAIGRTSRKPKVQAFVQLGYGQPGLNMLSESFDPYYLAGIRFSWQLTDWGKVNKEIQVSTITKDMIDLQFENFNRQIETQQQSILPEIKKYEELIEADREIISLQKEISTMYASQLKNGTITSVDYIHQLHAETQAKLDAEIHKIKLSQSKAEYLATYGYFMK